ncbi:MAG: hypothetical protein RLN76_07670 [Phycisphaeraceae bacterium]
MHLLIRLFIFRRKTIKLFLVFVAAMFLLLLLAWSVWMVGLKVRTAWIRWEIRAAGYPVTAEELDSWYAQPVGENAAVTLMEAYEMLSEAADPPLYSLPWREDEDDPASAIYGRRWPAEILLKTDDYLTSYRFAMIRAEQAVSVVDSRYPINLAEGYVVVLPHLYPARKLTRALRLKAPLEAQRGNAEEVVRAILLMNAIARSLDREPLHISGLLRISNDSLLYETIEVSLAHITLDESHYIKLIKAIASREIDDSLFRGLVGVRVMFDSFYDDPVFYDDPNEIPVVELDTNLGGWLIPALRWAGVWELNRQFGLIKYRQAAQDMKQAEIEVLALDQDFLELSLQTFVGMPLDAYVTDSNQEVHLVSMAQHRLMLLGLASYSYYAQHKRYPDSIAGLIADRSYLISKDPFAPEQLLKLRDTPFGLVLYSVGPDRIDDGGTPQEEFTHVRPRPGDIVFRVFEHPGEPQPGADLLPSSQ